jgi:hypothetical protein
MFKTAIAAAAALTVTAGAAMAESRTYDLEPFNQVDIATGLYAVIRHGDSQSVRVEANREDVLDKLDISVAGGQLHAKLHTNLLDIILSGGLLNMIGRDRSATIYITVPELTGVESASGAHVTADRLSGKQAVVSVSSGGDAALDAVDTGTLTLSASSGGRVSLAGRCDRLTVSVSSGGDVRANDLKCGDLAVSGSSGGSVEVAASGAVTGSVSSGASVRLAGTPASIKVETSSGGSVRAR